VEVLGASYSGSSEPDSSCGDYGQEKSGKRAPERAGIYRHAPGRETGARAERRVTMCPGGARVSDGARVSVRSQQPPSIVHGGLQFTADRCVQLEHQWEYGIV